jgi:hypothetical protein
MIMSVLRTPINLVNTNFMLKTVVDYLPRRSFCVGEPGKFRTLVDVGLVVFLPSKHVGSRINMTALDGLAEGDDNEGDSRLYNCPLFVAPETWTVGEALVKLGVFGTVQSAHQAGWIRPPEYGFDQHLVRISGTKCCVGLFRPTNLENFFQEAS